jgi:acetyl/propionyl-CoA carboxylase alpha subunit
MEAINEGGSQIASFHDKAIFKVVVLEKQKELGLRQVHQILAAKVLEIGKDNHFFSQLVRFEVAISFMLKLLDFISVLL